MEKNTKLGHRKRSGFADNIVSVGVGAVVVGLWCCLVHSVCAWVVVLV